MNNRHVLALFAGAVLVLGGCGPRSPQPSTQPSTPTAIPFVNFNTPTPQPAQVNPTDTPATWQTMPPATATPQPLPTATAEIQGFSAPAMSKNVDTDESAQPCPARYWRAGRCTATAAQIEQYAHEVQP